MITAAKTLLEKIHALPESLQTEVEHYVEFLLSKYSQELPTVAEPSFDGEKKRDGFGILAGKIWMSDDFDEPLEDMQEYM